MKTYNKIIGGLASMLLFAACSDFEDINHDPTKVDEDKVKSHYLLNRSIVHAQQNPHIAERVFVIEWKSAARFDRANGLATGNRYDAYNTDYLSTDFAVGWLNDVNMAINLSEKRSQLPDHDSSEPNVLQMSRIWRAYLVSELADCFGPIPPVNKYDGVIDYKSVEELYDFILQELKEAAASIDVDADMSAVKEAGTDKFFNGDMEKWIRYANSMRLRFAMRISGVAPEKVKAIVEELAKENKLITNLAHIASVQEVDGWNELAGVMSRSWNYQPVSSTINNMMIGLGGIKFQVPELIQDKVVLKDAKQYMGLYFPDHLTTKTNSPGAGYFFDDLPEIIDPRATVLYHIPGYDDGEHYFPNVNLADSARLVDIDYYKNPGDYKEPQYVTTLTTKYTWNTWVAGNWDYKSTVSSELLQTKTFPSISKKYRMSTNRRIFFAPWETHFLLAEAALKGWNVGSSDKVHYEAGISSSFEYHGLTLLTNAYLQSTEHNRLGTSVAYDDETEATDYTVDYIDGYTGLPGQTVYKYPKNTIYRNGEFNNDKLTKIITQKYLAQVPYLPLEAWNDHRRLGLPFFDNPAAETDFNPSNYQIPLTKNNYMECKWEFYQERFMYPEIMEINSKDSYETAVRLLGGKDNLYTPLWWTNRK